MYQCVHLGVCLPAWECKRTLRSDDWVDIPSRRVWTCVRQAGCGYGGMCVHLSGMVDVLIYELGGNVELSPAGGKKYLLDQFWGPEHAYQILVNEQRM